MTALLLVAQLVTARPGVDCSLLTAQQAQGLPCANAPKAEPTQLDPDCAGGFNPYEDPERAMRCARRPLPGDETPRFEVGSVYFYGYREVEAIILGVTTDTDGVQVITYRWLPRSGASPGQDVGAMRTPPAPGGRSPWTKVEP